MVAKRTHSRRFRVILVTGLFLVLVIAVAWWAYGMLKEFF